MIKRDVLLVMETSPEQAALWKLRGRIHPEAADVGSHVTIVFATAESTAINPLKFSQTASRLKDDFSALRTLSFHEVRRSDDGWLWLVPGHAGRALLQGIHRSLCAFLGIAEIPDFDPHLTLGRTEKLTDQEIKEVPKLLGGLPLKLSASSLVLEEVLAGEASSRILQRIDFSMP